MYANPRRLLPLDVNQIFYFFGGLIQRYNRIGKRAIENGDRVNARAQLFKRVIKASFFLKVRVACPEYANVFIPRIRLVPV